MMKLSELLSESLNLKTASQETLIKGLSLDSRAIKPGYLFLACPGIASDGREYIQKAIENGASAVLYEADSTFSIPPTKNIPIISVPNLSEHLGKIGGCFYGQPAEKMHMIGVTGTNGKTSCTQLIAQSLNSLNNLCATIGTLGYGFPPHPLIHSNHTTPDPITLQHQLSILQKEAKYLAMEVSSHALDQKRIQGLSFDTAIFTNLSQDHLDYHQTMEAYWEAKCILFEKYNIKQALVNLDDPYGLRLIEKIKSNVPVIGYTLSEECPEAIKDLSIIQAKKIRLSPKGISAYVSSPWGEGELKSPLLGRFNLNNLLASLGALCLAGIPFETACLNLSKANLIPGRMQTLGGKKSPLIVIDYAHTPEALRASLIALREHASGKLWCVFGCGGNRDQGKRSLMGQIAEQYSDQLIITDDNPRNENPKTITDQILSGLSCSWAAEVEHDRKVAIAHAVDCANPNDIILIAGKGHEQYQEIAGKKIPFNDFEQAELALQARTIIH